MKTMSKSAAPVLQRKCACASRPQAAANNSKRSSILRRSAVSADAPARAPPIIDGVLSSPGAPLDPQTRAFFEPRFGRDFSGVRIHSDAAAARSAHAVNAVAYTVGSHIVFGDAGYTPGTTAGRQLLAHELTHTVQQQGGIPSPGSRITIGDAGNAFEHEADRVAAEVMSKPDLAPGPPGSPGVPGITGGAGHSIVQRQISSSGSRPLLMRQQRRGSAAGCGICLGGDARIAGGIAHVEVQSAFVAMNPDIVPERVVRTVPDNEEAPFSPELDLSYEADEDGQHVIYIGEIKPLDDDGRQADEGRRKLQDYARELSFTFDVVFRMRDAPPAGPLFFANPANPPGCPPQLLYVQMTEPGLYQYYCEPPFSQLVRDPRCRCRRPDEEPEPLPVPERVPVPARRPQRVPVPRRAPQNLPQPVPAPEPAPAPEPVPAPEPAPAPAPEPAPAPGPGGDVIPFPGRPPATPPVTAPPEEIPQAARVRHILIEVGIPAAVISALLAIIIVAIVDPEPISKIVAALVAVLGISAVAATALAVIIMRQVRSSDSGGGGPIA